MTSSRRFFCAKKTQLCTIKSFRVVALNYDWNAFLELSLDLSPSFHEISLLQCKLTLPLWFSILCCDQSHLLAFPEVETSHNLLRDRILLLRCSLYSRTGVLLEANFGRSLQLCRGLSNCISLASAPELIPFLFLFFRFVSPFYPVIFSMVNKKGFER